MGGWGGGGVLPAAWDRGAPESQGVSTMGVEAGPKADLAAVSQSAVVAQVSLQSEQAFRLLLKTSV